jgi:aminoglycoside phosphotransferase (APT) family kinase protein
MSYVPGRVYLKPRDVTGWLEQMAAALAQIHQIEASQLGWEYVMWQTQENMKVPAWSSHPRLWERALDLVQAGLPVEPVCFIHRDYHPTNLLWRGEALSGVVDWVNACQGNPGIDVGHCRSNLSSLYGVEVADQFLETYQRFASAEYVYHPYWDLVACVESLSGPPSVYQPWLTFGMNHLTQQVVHQRHEAYFMSIMARLE